MPSAYENHYLSQYWPPRPNNPDMWQDNLELLQAYFLAADHVLKSQGTPVDALDISTGPCLAPLMATMGCVSSLVFSDFDETNRLEIVGSDVEYWREYARELVRMFPDRGLSETSLLSNLDSLRRRSPILDVDLRRTPIFVPDHVPPSSAGLITMHFVVDSICREPRECFELLERVLKLVRPGGWILMSALIDSSWWLLGDQREPSPKLSEGQIVEFLKRHGFTVEFKVNSVRKSLQIYEGGWTVFLAQAPSTATLNPHQTQQ